MRRVVALVVLLTILIAPGASAQLRGIVRDSTIGNGLAGAVVQVVDSTNRQAARTITDGEGRFSIPLTPASARLRIMHIGYRPGEVPVPADRIGPVDVRMSRIPPILDAVRVSDSELCPGSPERGAAFEIWQQARAGLLATIVARELNPAQAVTLTYNTYLSPTDLRVRRQTKSTVSGRTTRPFVASAQPSFFARMGYMLETGQDRIFNAPDADVLIDETFAATHCFRLRRADREHPGQIGVAFAPVEGRDTLVDVDGVIWVDAKTPQLRSLEFTYTSLEPAAMDADAGGHIAFKTMPNGISFIDRWNLRLASLQQPPGAARRNMTAVAKPRRTELSELQVRELVDAGGVVLSATWPDGTRWDAVKSVVTGVVVGKGSGRPAGGAIVTLTGTPDTVTTDSTGHFRIETIPGKYALQAVDTTLGAFVKPRSQSASVEIRLGAEASTRLEVDPIERVMAEVCRGQSMPAGSGLITGVVAIDGQALPNDAVIDARFQRIDDLVALTSEQRISPDVEGRFVVCGTPRDRKVQLTLRTPKGALADTSVIVPFEGLTHRVVWMVPASRP